MPHGRPAVGGNSMPPMRFESLKSAHQRRNDLPHLRNVFLPSPRTYCGISVYDFDRGWDCLHVKHSQLDYRYESTVSSVADLVLESPVETSTRLIVIEDICSGLIADLINLLDVDIELFEKHLLNCGWKGHHAFSDPESTTWVSKRAKRPYCSINWCRPYKTSPSIRSVSIDHQKLTVKDAPPLDNDDTFDPPKSNESVLEYQINTWRTHLNFDVTNSTWSEQHDFSIGLTPSTTIASDERLTIWRGNCDSHDLVIVLTDIGFCGPAISPSNLQTTDDQVYMVRRRNLLRTVTRRYPRTEPVSTIRDTHLNRLGNGSNVNLRPLVSGPLSTESVTDLSQDGHQQADLAFEGTATTDPGNRVLPTAEDDSVYFSSLSLPVASRDELHSPSEDHTNTGAAASSQHERNVTPSQSNAEEDRPLDFPPPRRQPLTRPICNMASRCPIEYTMLEQAYQRGFFVPLTTTREDFGAWVEELMTLSGQSKPKHLVISKTFMIFNHDTLDFLQSVEQYLDEVISASNDEVKLEKNITMWRKMLGYLDIRIRQIMDNAPAFAHFLSAISPPSTEYDSGDDDGRITQLLDELIKMGARVRGHLQYANTVITSSISVAESRRGIAEAESVTKLTELAFVYIPLSFAASFFGMQVKELDPSTTSIVAFVGLAIGVVTMSYAIRLVIRSQAVIESRQKMMASVRRDADIADAQPVRTRDFLRWIWHKSVTDFLVAGRESQYRGNLIKFFVLFAGMIVMISVWTSATLIPNMKIVISLAAVELFAMFFAFTCFRRLRHSLRERSRLRRRRIQRRRTERQ